MNKLYIMMGLPGSGKSKAAEELQFFNPKRTEIISSDKIREELYGDESIQGNPKEVFDLVMSRGNAYLKKGVNVIIDSTNINSKKRRHLISAITSDVEVEVIGVVVPASINACVRFDSQRERTVGYQVIHRMWKQWQTPHLKEGFDRFMIVEYHDYEELEEYVVQTFRKLENFNQDNENHKFKLLDHLLFTGQKSESFNDPLLEKAAHLHDIGKVHTKTFVTQKGIVDTNAHYYGHENVGAYDSILIQMLENKRSSSDILYTSFLINYHMVPYDKNAQKSFVRKFGEKAWADVLKLHECDKNSHKGGFHNEKKSY